jgi:hypothetical protein
MHSATRSYPTVPPHRMESAPAHPPHLREIIVARINAYKAGLLEEFSEESETFLRFARLAINEAEGLAFSTSFAHLFFPALAEEKIQYARDWASRQCQVGNALASASSFDQS